MLVTPSAQVAEQANLDKESQYRKAAEDNGLNKSKEANEDEYIAELETLLGGKS